MTEQEEIREGMGNLKFRLDRVSKFTLSPQNVDILLSYLHSQGVVIKVEREFDLDDEALMANILPDVFNGSLDAGDYYEESDKYKVFMEPILEAIEEAGYVAVIPLKEER